MPLLRTLPALLLGALVLTGCAGGNALDVINGWRSGVCGLIYAVVIIWAFVRLANSSADTGSKLLWGALVFFFPFGGLLIWWFAGPKD